LKRATEKSVNNFGLDLSKSGNINFGKVEPEFPATCLQSQTDAVSSSKTTFIDDPTYSPL
jgi:hypothetical protein